MLDQDFFDFLEYEICIAFEHSDNEEIKGFWCDGVALNQPDNSYSKKFVNDNRQITLKAFICKDVSLPASTSCIPSSPVITLLIKTYA